MSVYQEIIDELRTLVENGGIDTLRTTKRTYTPSSLPVKPWVYSTQEPRTDNYVWAWGGMTPYVFGTI